jgi:Ca-activated chloride channel family protein
MRKLPLLLFALLLMGNLTAQSPIVFILDASGSMWGKIEQDFKMDIATDVLSATIGKLPAEQRVGLVVYGHRQKGDCRDVEYMVEMENQDKPLLIQKMKEIKPLGKTPLAYSATLVIDQLRSSGSRATIILITDGIESCDGDLCKVAKDARAEGIDFKMHIVGFGLKKEETAALKCAAKAGEGQYYDAGDAGGLSEVINEATQSTVDDPPPNISVYALSNEQPIDAYIKAYKAGEETGIAAARTYQDTAFFYLPPGEYDLSVKPLEGSDVPAVKVNGVQISEEALTHKDVRFDEGEMLINATNNGEGWDAVVKIFDQKGVKVAGGRTYGRAKTFKLNPGVYTVQLEALVLQGEGQAHRTEEVVIEANTQESVNHDFESGTLMIGANSPSGLVDAVIKILDAGTNKNVAGGRTYTSSNNNPREFLLSPGEYKVTLNTLGKHKGQTETIVIGVEKGKETRRILQFE